MIEASRQMGRRVGLLSLVALSCHRGVVTADDTLNGVVSEAFGESCRSFPNRESRAVEQYILYC